MKFDTLIIGGGIAGLSCALRCQQQGQKTAVLTKGQSAMHFSSGSIDVLAHLPSGELVSNPFSAITQLTQQKPQHPYAKIGAEKVKKSLHWFTEKMAQEGLNLISHHDASDEDLNHVRLTPMGLFKATWASQDTVYPFIQQNPAQGLSHITLMTFEGFRDFQPELASANLKALPQFKKVEVDCVSIEMKEFDAFSRNPCEFRSIDISNILENEEVIHSFARYMSMLVKKSTDIVVLPAVFKGKKGTQHINLLKKLTGLTICEMPTTPPSLLGIRIESALKQLYKEAGGYMLEGDEVKKGEFKEGALTGIYTKNYKDYPLLADNFVLATGSFFSHGLKANKTDIYEGVFDLDVEYNTPRKQWRADDFFPKQGHPFLAFGVKTDENFRPYYKGTLIHNLYCAGAILAHYHPVIEGSGNGVAISTGYYVAGKIINHSERS